MKTEELKRIPIWELLSHLGIEPVSKRGGGAQLLYHSPLRPDRNASFSVSTRKNLWMDFGTSQGGNVIDLAIALKGYCPFWEAVVWLEEQASFFRSDIRDHDISRYDDIHMSRLSGHSDVSNMRVEDLTSPRLLEYLESRGIPSGTGRRYCKEAHYTVRDREYYGVAFLNILGGMEIRSRFFKGCHGVKAPTVVSVEKTKRTSCCCVFEGFMDFLSYMVLEEKGATDIVQSFPYDCIILNSTSIIQRAIPFIGVYSIAYCYLDNDFAGKQALDTLDLLMPGRILEMSSKFAPYNDLNDYLVQQHPWETGKDLTCIVDRRTNQERKDRQGL
jgi:hypothetical protein